MRWLLPALLAVVFAAGCNRADRTTAAAAEQRQPVEVTPVTRRDMAETLNLVGSVAANESATIRPETTGLVRSIHFDEGQRVTRGDLLVKIDDSELRAQSAQSEAAFRLAELNLQRAEKLWETRSNSMADLDRARSEFTSAKSDRDLIKVRLDRCEIRAPFDGVLGARTLSPGDYVNSQSIITTIDDLSRLKIDFQAPERFLAKIQRGTKFNVVARPESAGDGGSVQLAGEVYFVSSVIDRATRASEVKGYLLEAPARLKPGMFANIEVVLSITRDALTVPEGAVLTTPSGARIVAVRHKDGRDVAEFIPVRLGLRAKGFVAIEPIGAALAVDESVVSSGVGALILFPGASVEPRPARAPLKADPS